MKKQNRNNSSRIKRKNLNSRLRAKKANKQNNKSFIRRVRSGELTVNDSVQPTTKAIWPNTAQPKSSY